MRIAAAPVFDPDLPADRTDDDRPGCGEARTPQRALPLVAIDIDVSLSGLTASCRLRQRFTNPTDRPVEVTYVFPLPNRGAVTAMTATLGGRRVEGRLLELTGPAGGEYSHGADDRDAERLSLDAVEFCRTLAGRRRGDGLLATIVPF